MSITQCEIVEVVPATSSDPAGFALIELRVTNWAWWDRTYVVPVDVMNSVGERVGGSPEGDFTLTIPARHGVTARRNVDLARTGGIKCEVGQVKRVD